MPKPLVKNRLSSKADIVSLKITPASRKEGARTMLSNKALTGVGVAVMAAGMSRTLPAAEAAATAHPAFWAYPGAGAVAAIAPQRKRRTTAATGQSVDRGTT
jgi:hypothetical protein